MMAAVEFEEPVWIPLGMEGLEDFRDWCHSGKFPENGRIDFVVAISK